MKMMAILSKIYILLLYTKMSLIHKKCKTYLRPHEKSNDLLSRSVSRRWFYGNEIPKIYNIPPPMNVNYVVSVVSFGGGLYGNVSNTGVLTNGDIQKYWASIGISPSNFPTVIVKLVGGARNLPDSDLNSTIENTIDIQCVGMSCPSSKLTIVLYIAPNSFSSFVTVLSFILNDTQYRSNAISISWGAPEVYYNAKTIQQINNLFATAVSRNINVVVASGDDGSNNGVGGSGSYCDFPSSSPNVIACGGTTLVCPNRVYDTRTNEYAWASGGGGISAVFTKPTYQRNIPGTKRSTPDLALIADPNTGVLFLINNKQYIIGGTSIATPIFVGFLAASNTRHFVNPIIYNIGVLHFNDVINGSNGAYRAKDGYDNCTGFGSLKGNVLSSIINYNVSVNVNAVTLQKNSSFTLTTTSSSNYNSYLSWSSNNNNIATVSASGVVTGINNGNVTLTLKTINPYVIKTVIVTVSNISRTNRILINHYSKK
jgi:kumamolisin